MTDGSLSYCDYLTVINIKPLRCTPATNRYLSVTLQLKKKKEYSDRWINIIGPKWLIFGYY